VGRASRDFSSNATWPAVCPRESALRKSAVEANAAQQVLLPSCRSWFGGTAGFSLFVGARFWQQQQPLPIALIRPDVQQQHFRGAAADEARVNETLPEHPRQQGNDKLHGQKLAPAKLTISQQASTGRMLRRKPIIALNLKRCRETAKFASLFKHSSCRHLVQQYFSKSLAIKASRAVMIVVLMVARRCEASTRSQAVIVAFRSAKGDCRHNIPVEQTAVCERLDADHERTRLQSLCQECAAPGGVTCSKGGRGIRDRSAIARCAAALNSLPHAPLVTPDAWP
jgi:hypothetical protein